MNQTFKDTFQKFAEESQELKKKEADLQASSRLFNEKMGAFLRASGLAENFTIPELVNLALMKSEDKE